MRDIQIFVCTQNNNPWIRNYYPYTPIQTGKALHPEVELGFLVDNIGDNISNQNANLCEWCAHYWAWKNIKDVKYFGLCHYRRYFDLDLNLDNIDGIFKRYDTIVIKQATKMISKRERVNNLIRMTSMEDTYLFFDTFLDIHPEYEKQLIDYFYNSRESIPYTMIIAPKNKYDSICEFVIPVLLKMQERRKEHGYSRTNRAVAYAGEFILGLAIHCLGYNMYKAPLVFMGEANKEISPLGIIKRNLLYCVKRISSLISDSVCPVPAHIKCPTAVRVGLKNDGIELSHLM